MSQTRISKRLRTRLQIGPYELDPKLLQAIEEKERELERRSNLSKALKDLP